MNGTTPSQHGHHQVSAAIFVGSLIIGAAMILAAELTKPPRYEYHAAPANTANVVFDRDSGRAAELTMGGENPFEKNNRAESK
ncbi:MAG TPA: hypothetical protein VFE46_17180 [Pirellulales bacterium]|jgi:hypothetical protein|nr:hypothetical protein [Pirellulales bacterium]